MTGASAKACVAKMDRVSAASEVGRMSHDLMIERLPNTDKRVHKRLRENVIAISKNW